MAQKNTRRGEGGGAKRNSAAGVSAGGSNRASGLSRVPDDTPIDLSWTLAELPSSQHRAGLAGLVLMARWLKRLPRPRVVCAITAIDAAGASLRINRAGMRALFDEIYGADLVEKSSRTKWKGAEPLREEKRAEADQVTGEKRTLRYFVYETVEPRGAYLRAHDTSKNKLWLKLWRDMVWGTIRGVPKTRIPYEDRARGKPGTVSKEADVSFDRLVEGPAFPDEVPSSLFIGAMARSAEMVPFADQARLRWLLHFWTFVAQAFVPNVIASNGEGEFKGYAVAVPDVADLELFCAEYPALLDGRSMEAHRSGFRPEGAVVDLAGEGALVLLSGLRKRLARLAGRTLADVVLGVDVFHLEKPGKALKIVQFSRVEPVDEQVDEYEQVRRAFKNATFRRQRLVNVLAGRPWHVGFDAVFATVPWKQTVGSHWFAIDARSAFGVSDTVAQPEEESMEQLIYRFVQAYVLGRVESKHGLRWSEAKQAESSKGQFNEAKAKIARDAFLAIRSRTGEDFVSYFAATLGSVPHRLDEAQFAQLATALRERTEEVRTLTMLALSAHA